MAGISKQTLVALAEQKMADARALFASGRFSNAYYLAGYAAELMLKAVISRRFSADTFPDKVLVNSIHTHI